jgi:hypothetical protein
MTKKSALLATNPHPTAWKITMRLQNNLWAEFRYGDHDMARNHYDQLRATEVLGGSVIKAIEFLAEYDE